MSDTGPSEHPQAGDPREASASSEGGPNGHIDGLVRRPRTSQQPPASEMVSSTMESSTQTMTEECPPVELRVHFADFASQLRTQRHHEYKRRMLEHRRQHLQKAVSLSARLQRVGSWVHDGLVEISSHTDPSGFVRVHQHTQDLVDICFSQWNHEIRAMDPINQATRADNVNLSDSFLSKLSAASRTACLDFLQAVRSNPRFLIERFKVVTPSQISSLSTSPKFQDISSSVLSSLSQNRGRSSQKRRIKSYSKGLEEYATSFERTNPLSFLIYNCFGSPDGNSPKEDQLRLSTWSTVCAGLLQESGDHYQALIDPVLNGFSPLHGWQAKDRLELFLMDILQRGAFLLEMIGDQTPQTKRHAGVQDTLDTDLAKDFFDNAVRDLFAILFEHDGGFPLGALELGRAILAKIPSIQAQSDFRGHFFWGWFLSDFLRITITYPENEKMLLQFHISEAARSHILHQLWSRACQRAFDVASSIPQGPIDTQIRSFVDGMVALLEPREIDHDPYASDYGRELGVNVQAKPDHHLSSLTICAGDVIQVLEALSPLKLAIPQDHKSQDSWDPFFSSTSSAFNLQYASASSRFDRMRRELLVMTEPGYSSKIIHPCQESWLVLTVRGDGTVEVPSADEKTKTPPHQAAIMELGELDNVQKAALRLLTDDSPEGRFIAPGSFSDSGPVAELTLARMFMARAKAAYSSADSVSALYWESAYNSLLENHPLSILMNDDTRVLRSLVQSSSKATLQCTAIITTIETQVAVLEDTYSRLKSLVSTACLRLNRLKVKMWYVMDVVSSNAYEDAKNVSQALNYMALSVGGQLDVGRSPSLENDRPGTSTSTSSLLDQPRVDTMSILKAPSEHGGPKKLADTQIEMTNKWLDRHGVENFCKGEERIHRFCMEVKMATKKLVAETLSESPVLWSSELWTREKNAFEVHTNIAVTIPGSTRAPSIMSETFPSTFYPVRPIFRTQEGSIRSLDTDITGSPARKASFHSLGSNRINRELLGSELASSLASPGRSWTATTAESISSIWSPLPSQSRSMTSASMQSRPASIYNDFSNLRLGDTNSEKTKFLETLQQELTCLLLSDLGNPVWSCGSETDAWMDTVKSNVSIDQRLHQRKVMSRLLSAPKSSQSKATGEMGKALSHKKRSASMDDIESTQGRHGAAEARPISNTRVTGPGQSIPDTVKYQVLLDKISQQVDPNLKLQAVQEFKQLALLLRESEGPRVALDEVSKESSVTAAPRRRSLGPGTASSFRKEQRRVQKLPQTVASVCVPAEDDTVDYLKELLLTLTPKTLFRDLQYIAAFVPSDILNKSESGRAFLHLGLAALACKDEVCRSMVDLADQIVTKDSIKRMVSLVDPMEQPLVKAREYWVLAAREGNAIAQRELAGLYLAHPEVPPIVSLPLALSKEIFKNEMMWEQGRGENTNTQALCLALHWMQQAADNGDPVAQLKLRERGNPSIR